MCDVSGPTEHRPTLTLHGRLLTVERVSTEGQRGTHCGEAALLLPDDGPEAQETSCHDESTSEDEDVSRGGKCAGGQDVEVTALLHQCPDTHSHDSCPTYLQRHKADQVAPEALPAVICLVPTWAPDPFQALCQKVFQRV